MKVAISIGVAVVLPFGFLVLAGIIVNHVLANRGPPGFSRRVRQHKENHTGQPPALSLCNVELATCSVNNC
jgi:hypothetical protein